jgi:hypothetical protein
MTYASLVCRTRRPKLGARQRGGDEDRRGQLVERHRYRLFRWRVAANS